MYLVVRHVSRRTKVTIEEAVGPFGTQMQARLFRLESGPTDARIEVRATPPDNTMSQAEYLAYLSGRT